MASTKLLHLYHSGIRSISKRHHPLHLTRYHYYRQLSTSSIDGSSLRRAVLRASSVDVGNLDSSLDLNGIFWLEHVNLVVGSRSIAEHFYRDYLGFSEDSYNDKSSFFHLNLGQQQLHLVDNGDPPQRTTGSIGLTVPSLLNIRERTKEMMGLFEGTLFSVLSDTDECITLSCPWGNTIHLYGVDNDIAVPNNTKSKQAMTNMHANGGIYGPRMAVRCQPGIRFVEISCPPGTTNRIAKFYEEMLSCDVVRSELQRGVPTAVVSVGPGVHLVYTESETLNRDDEKAMEGVHICIYVNHFKTLYNRLKEKGLLFTNPRFTYLDTCDTWEETQSSRTLRFKNIIDLETSEVLLELEHETRSLRHGQFFKVPFYEPM